MRLYVHIGHTYIQVVDGVTEPFESVCVHTDFRRHYNRRVFGASFIYICGWNAII